MSIFDDQYEIEVDRIVFSITRKIPAPDDFKIQHYKLDVSWADPEWELRELRREPSEPCPKEELETVKSAVASRLAKAVLARLKGD